MEVDLGDVASRLWTKWKVLAISTLIAAALAYGVSRIMPKTYESRATIYVQQEGLSGRLLSDLPISIASPGNSSSGYIVALLESDTMLTKVISDLNLTRRTDYSGSKGMSSSALMKRLRETVRFGQGKSGRIDIAAKARKRELAAEIANSFLDNLGALVTTRSMSKARFISEKLADISEKLQTAEGKLLQFQEENDVNSISEETAGMISKLAELDGRALGVEVQLREIESELANSGELNALVELEVRKKALQESKQFLDARIEEIQRSMGELPVVTLRYARLQRNVGVLSKTYELLTEQYQLATISQHGEDGDYQIIDRARPVDEPVSPRAMLNAAIGGVLGFFASAFLVIWAGRIGHGKTPHVAGACPPVVRKR
ncbi:MAG: hypothetical protein A2Z18_08005 [Armatimonadetes bacterium RBG_16_58_9]|nr:MAG: hypothetical protein A2Z18_08005 [Armatimonadetes bacterium RBG_16_58_9]